MKETLLDVVESYDAKEQDGTLLTFADKMKDLSARIFGKDSRIFQLSISFA
jgi:hypothetical protein